LAAASDFVGDWYVMHLEVGAVQAELSVDLIEAVYLKGKCQAFSTSEFCTESFKPFLTL